MISYHSRFGLYELYFAGSSAKFYMTKRKATVVSNRYKRRFLSVRPSVDHDAYDDAYSEIAKRDFERDIYRRCAMEDAQNAEYQLWPQSDDFVGDDRDSAEQAYSDNVLAQERQ